MKKEELASMLNGRQYRDEITPDIQHALQESDLVVVYGASDDLMEFRGAIDEELGAWDGGLAYLNKDGILLNECEDDDCPHFKKLMANGIKVEQLWCEEPKISWTYKTDIPHSTFEILEDGETYCRGIVFNLSDIAV